MRGPSLAVTKTTCWTHGMYIFAYIFSPVFELQFDEIFPKITETEILLICSRYYFFREINVNFNSLKIVLILGSRRVSFGDIFLTFSQDYKLTKLRYDEILL